MSRYFRDSLNEQLKDEEFRKEYESLEAEFQIIKEIIRFDWNNTRRYKQNRKRKCQPSLKTLKKLAAAFGKKLVISFE